MTAPAHGRTSTPEQGEAPRDASRTKLAQSIGDLCPDELRVLREICEAGGYVSPRRLHAAYLQVTASADADFDFGGALTYFLHHQSVPVDARVGERATDRVMKEIRP